MTPEEVIALIRTIGLPSAYHHFEEGHSPKPPYLVYHFPSFEHYGADNGVYHKQLECDLELYTSLKDLATEQQVEHVLDTAPFYYDKVEVYLPSEKLYQVTYSFTF
ncbi:hypothetical protein [Streptococcus cristatus]|uniref:hypothetical protein n=1 Tax=Streptococcus cristatus TaxID=45634 RepID=UPI001EF3681F|nr:hypothetical protein [Streptococcus cristatus]MCG7329911.1 hypothetical protein [Streptococcus cristatus]